MGVRHRARRPQPARPPPLSRRGGGVRERRPDSPAADEAPAGAIAQAGLMRRASSAAVAVAVAMSLSLFGCTSEAAPEPAACEGLEAVQRAMSHLENANVSENGLEQVRTDLNRLRDELTAMSAQ